MCSINDVPERVGHLLERRLGGVFQACKPLLGYQAGFELMRDGSRVCHLLYGGNGGRPHVRAQGEDSHELAMAIRELWPDAHWVTRADAAQDFDDGEGTWEKLAEAGRRFAEEYSLNTDQRGDWLRDDVKGLGRTLYIGSPRSPFYVRIYEKGKQVNKYMAEQGGTARMSETLVRVECEAKPGKLAREKAASMSPEELWGLSNWGQVFCLDVFGVVVEKVNTWKREASDLDITLGWMRHQYGDTLQQKREELGCDFEFAEWLLVQLDRKSQASAEGSSLRPALS